MVSSNLKLLFASWLCTVASAFGLDSIQYGSVSNSSLAGYKALFGRDFPAGEVPLSVLCVGDSITVGVGDGHETGTGTNNGYRLDLYYLLKNSGINVQFIGTQSSGTDNPQPAMEGYGGQTISTIRNAVEQDSIIRQQPNVVLVHAGTNDNDIPSIANDAPNQLGQLIDYINCQDPNAVVLVAKLIQNKYAPDQTNWFNSQVPDVVAQRYKAGYKVRVVDMSMIGGDELTDLLHPTTQGYADMANRWFAAIEAIPDYWWAAPNGAGPKYGGPIETCARGANYFTPAIGGAQVAAGAHVDNDPGEPLSTKDGNTFSPGWSDQGVIAIGTGNPGPGVVFADLDGDGRNDYIWIDYTTGITKGWLNPQSEAWLAINNGDAMTFGYPGTSYVEFADLTGDKKAEYIVVADGHFRVWQNNGPSGNIWLWGELPGAGPELDYFFGGTAGFHYFADMNGDGKADLIVWNPNNVLDIYFNNGPSGDGFTWTQCLNKGIAAPKMWFVDIDGDGRADYLSMDDDGGVSGWLNKPGGSCDITWVAIDGRTAKSVALGTGAPAGQVRLADLTGDGKADYVVVSDDVGALHLWSNVGSNHAPDSTGLGGYGAAVRLNDLDGDGRDDYLSITDVTGVLAYLNKGQNGDSGWTWEVQENGVVVALGYAGATRHEIHFADVNGDGRDDYLVVDDDTGAVHCYLNLGPSSTSNWQWDTTKGEIAIGVGGVGAGVRFADFNGDGRADYIYLDENGAATVWLNLGPGDTLTNWHVINDGHVAALGVGANRADVQFADIDGDGAADYLWVHPDTGEVDVWYNLYTSGGQTGTIGWLNSGSINGGEGYPGQNMRFARIGTSGRADLVAIEEDTGAIKAWINQCSSVIGTINGRFIGGCGAAPLPTQTTAESLPTPPTPVSVAAGGQTVIQDSTGGQVTLQTGIATPTVITENGATVTFIPGGNSVVATTTDSDGATVIQGSLGARTTLPPGITTPVTVTQSDGEVVTFIPGQVIASTTTSSSSTVLPFFVYPVYTDVPNVEVDNNNLVIPCSIWFFLFCINWDEGDIKGWLIPIPTIKIIGPGPPPAITFPPALGITVQTRRPLPPWPKITIGPDNKPTYSSEPPDQCTTQTGEICFLSTTVSASGTSSTTISTSTCQTVLGCEATSTTDTFTTTISTSSACSYPTDRPYTSLPATTATPTSPKNTQTPTTQLLPTQTAGRSGSAACNPSLGYALFQKSDAGNVLQDFCTRGIILAADDTQYQSVSGVSADGKVEVVVEVGWATDQTGCKPKTDINFANSAFACAFDFDTDLLCPGDPNDSNTSYGGAYVLNDGNDACIVFEISATLVT